MASFLRRSSTFFLDVLVLDVVSVDVVVLDAVSSGL
jgi:hypothetical protein